MSDLQAKILKILQKGEFHSGESLGRQLGVSRTAIWKQLQKLEALGLQLESIKGVGYRLPDSFELLSKPVILNYIMERHSDIPSEVEIFHSIDSTNKYARERAEKEGFSGGVILAENQTAGRGRRGKTWVSPFAASIYMSLVWDFEQGAESLQGLSLAVSVGVRRALADLGLQNIQLKWPNDIYIDGKKLGGILLEMIGDPNGRCTVIIGIGLNVSMPSLAAEKIDQPWTDVQSQAALPISRNELTAVLIVKLYDLLKDFQNVGFQAYRDEWQEADLLQNLPGTVRTVKDAISGIVLGVDSSGALRLGLPNGEVQRFIGGELSLRPSE
jgi:BirA family biotin operon repressor/biotin-[acetyl-CoA-carboxylase] ligase